MPKVGDRVIIDGTKVGAQRREGSLLGVVGSLIKVRWEDGSESIITPGAGSVRFEPGAAASRGSTAVKRVAKKPAAKAAKKR